MERFLDDPEVKALMVYYEGKDLKALNKPPSKYKSKAVYFVKHGDRKLDIELMAKHVLLVCTLPLFMTSSGDDFGSQ